MMEDSSSSEGGVETVDIGSIRTKRPSNNEYWKSNHVQGKDIYSSQEFNQKTRGEYPFSITSEIPKSHQSESQSSKPSSEQFRKAVIDRTSSLRVMRPQSHITSDGSDETKSLFPSTTQHQLQTTLLSVDENSSLKSNWSSGHLSSVDLSSLHSYSVTSAPLSCINTHSMIQKVSEHLLPSSISTSRNLECSINFSSPVNHLRLQRDLNSNIIASTAIASSESSDETHKLRLQLYVFVLRCIAYPFTVSLPQDPVRRYLKITNDYFSVLRERFSAFLNNEMTIVCDEAFINAVRHFDNVFLKSNRVETMVKCGAFSMNDIREVFISSIERRLFRFETIDSMPKQTVINAWKVKFDQICRGGEGPCPIAIKLGAQQLELTNPTKEQLYELFMQILSIKKYEHQILYNACQLDNIDEQAAQIRRELASQKAYLEEMAVNRSYPKMVHKEMELQYVEERLSDVNKLMLLLDSVPVGKSHSYSSGAAAVGVVVQLQRRLKRYGDHPTPGRSTERVQSVLSGSDHPTSPQPNFRLSTTSKPSLGGWSDDQQTDSLQVISPMTYPGTISNLSIQLSFHLEVSICQLRPLRHLPGNKLIFCTIELEGYSNRQRTASVMACQPIWDTIAEFEMTHPLPCVKVKLLRECTSSLALSNKELGRVILLPHSSTSRLPTWYKMQTSKHCLDSLDLQIAIRQEKPSNLKYCGYCWVQGRTTFKKWKLRYLCLIQVSQYTFIMAAFKEARSTAYESMVLDGYTVDYCEFNSELVASAKAELATATGGLLSSSMPTLNRFRLSNVTGRNPRHGAISGIAGTGMSIYRLPRFFFNLVCEGDALTFAVSEESELYSWVQVIHRATGQSHKPIAPAQIASTRSHLRKGARDRAYNSGLTVLASVKPLEVDQLSFLRHLQTRLLDYRLRDSFVSLGWLSPAQTLVLDEYCHRFGIRDCQRHLIFLQELLSYGEKGHTIDLDLLHKSYSICADHVQGKTQENGINTVLNSEMEDFQHFRTRLSGFLEKRLTEFRHYFPFNQPRGALEKLLTLLEMVICQTKSENLTSEAVRTIVHSCLRNAAVLTYENISDCARLEARLNIDPNDVGLPTPDKRLSDLLRLAEMCIETQQQNEDYYSKAFIWFRDLFLEHCENFLSLFQMDMVEVLDDLPSDYWGIFQLFQLMNSYLVDSELLANGTFHSSLLERFSVILENYLKVMENSITELLIRGIENENWLPFSGGWKSDDQTSRNIEPFSYNSTVDVDSISVSSLNPIQQSRNPSDITSSGLHMRVDTSGLKTADIRSNSVRSRNAFISAFLRSPSLASVRKKLSKLTVTRTLTKPVAADSEKHFEQFPSELARSLESILCCRTVVTLICRLHILDEFIDDLAWPEHTKSIYFADKIRTICYQLLREASKRTLIELESTLRRRSKSEDVTLPSECLIMMNTLTAIRLQLLAFCNRNELTVVSETQQDEDIGYSNSSDASLLQPTCIRIYTETEAFFEGIHRQACFILTDHLVAFLSIILSKLARFDEGYFISSILTLTKLDSDEGRNYINYIRANLQALCNGLVDEVNLLTIFEQWYSRQLRMINDWLIQRQNKGLNTYQLKCLSTIVKKVFSEFELQGVATHVLESQTYSNVCHRLQVEETTLSVSSCTGGESNSSGKSSQTGQQLLKAIGGGLSNLVQSTNLRPHQI